MILRTTILLIICFLVSVYVFVRMHEQTHVTVYAFICFLVSVYVFVRMHEQTHVTVYAYHNIPSRVEWFKGDLAHVIPENETESTWHYNLLTEIIGYQMFGLLFGIWLGFIVLIAVIVYAVREYGS